MTTTTIKSETVLKTADFEVLHFRGVDLDACYAYEVYDADDDLVHECDDRGEALEYVRDEQEALDRERAEERLNALKDEIIELVTDSESEATLRKILAQMKRAK
jgi:YD repeat-containing protein